ncbi:DNA methyltransferase [Sphingobacterium sp. HMSC13C05]|uniref:DNA methyltransferase n=1 Tax=Sphingobacterium sp. HMSC13C05 TaxID=1581095 RepID=UPI0008A2E32D|nr:DNA methyltransferase [Sphingobacterium sp. HMSC13C05]OFV15360.1 DNA methyltransferase [Sphingobacterium sp. HMSC13C05]
MKSTEIKHNVQNLIDNFSKDEFVFDLLVAYGISKTSVTRLKKGDYNLSKVDGEILYKKKIFFKVEVSNKLLSSIEEVSKEERILKHQPRFAILTDHKQVVAKDLKLGKNLDIQLKELPNYFDFFLPLAGSEVYNASNNNEADRNASYKMASLYDLLIDENPSIYNSKESIHNLNIFLSRLLFCFFAEDTEIFEQDSIFTNTLAQHTAENGKDTHTFLDDLFDRLDSENDKGYPDFLAKFPYVNGGLFNQKINSPLFTAKARKTLIELGELQWKDINPDIFGSMIQAVVIPEYRSDLGMHYTSVENILKLIKPLFLDELYEAYENATSVNHLRTLIKRISKIKFFDPACGSGNFLIITYKEIRLLEIKILEKITDLEGQSPTIKWTEIQLSQFYGIEIDDFTHEMAILSLWLAEHQMNKVFEERLFDYGKSKPILPLKEAGQIKQGNATRKDWNEVCPISKKDEVYIIGNPPYLGSRNQTKDQKDDLKIVFSKDYKTLDYIAAWFYKGAKYIEGYNAKCAFVSTNSICQGLSVLMNWPRILNDQIEIDFAHQSFKWINNAKGNAGVTVIILGLRNRSIKPKYLFNDNLRKEAKNINAYLLDANNYYIKELAKPSSILKPMMKGNAAIDDGNFLFNTEEEAVNFKTKYPEQSYLVREFIGSNELINGNKRFCLWLKEAKENDVISNPEIKQRVEKVKLFRAKSPKAQTRKYAEKPTLFMEDRQPESEYLMIPVVSSENRTYIPIGFLNKEVIANYSSFILPNATPLEFAVLTSRMHMVWVRNVGGKLEERLRYSAKLCYNTFPFPDITIKQKENLNLYVFAILDERAKHPSKTMAQLYNPTTMPKDLLQVHQELDTAIEQCYRLQPFKNDTERLEYLFKQYEEMLQKDTLFAKQKPSRKKK